MSVTLTIRDESLTPGGDDHVFEIEFPSESITVRELIRERIYQEVDDYNRRVRTWSDPGRYRGLVQPRDDDHRPDDQPPTPREIDWREPFALALRAYEDRRVLVLVGDRQTESLDERVIIGPGTEVSFIRLVPLVGG